MAVSPTNPCSGTSWLTTSSVPLCPATRILASAGYLDVPLLLTLTGDPALRHCGPQSTPRHSLQPDSPYSKASGHSQPLKCSIRTLHLGISACPVSSPAPLPHHLPSCWANSVTQTGSPSLRSTRDLLPAMPRPRCAVLHTCKALLTS